MTKLKSAKAIAKENGINYHTLRNWVLRGIVKCSTSISGRYYFDEEQERELINNLIKRG
jgi:predicted site-specific integrase-resolvase